MRRIILRSFQSPGDVVMLTAAVRDLHRAYPNEFQTDVRTSADELWENNPWLTSLSEHDDGVEVIDMHYPAIHQSNERPYHFIHGFTQYLEQQLDARIPVTSFRGDIHLSEDERSSGAPHGAPEDFWIIIAGGKYDFTTKWWNPASYQAVVDHFSERLNFVQCGEDGHWHPRLKNVCDFVGKTGVREFVRLVYHAKGVICPVTFAMHLSAAIPTPRGRAPLRPCVVIAGGREPAHWEAYPGHQFIDTVGTLPCCHEGGCWKSRCQRVGDGDSKDSRDLCEAPVQVTEDLEIPKCMDMITPGDVTRRIELYLEGDSVRPARQTARQRRLRRASKEHKTNGHLNNNIGDKVKTAPSERVLIRFRHGLGDAAQLRVVLRHLQRHRPHWRLTVAAMTGKHSAVAGLPAQVIDFQREEINGQEFDETFDLDWHECGTSFRGHPSTKAGKCLQEVFGITPELDLYTPDFVPSPKALRIAKSYLAKVAGDREHIDGKFPVVLIHYEGNTSADKKNLSHDAIRRVCQTVIEAGSVPVILDWDRRSPLPDGQTIFNPGVDSELWGNTGTGDAEMIAALAVQSQLTIGIDSGPLHVALACGAPAIGVWREHHPIHYATLSDSAEHLVPEDHARHIRGNTRAGERFFEKHYRSRTYRNADNALAPYVACKLGLSKVNLVWQSSFWIRHDNAEQDMVVVRDIYENDAYGVSNLRSPGGDELVVDVGAHIGSFARLWHERNPNARIVCIEACPENLEALRKNVGGFATVIHAGCTYEDKPLALLNAVRPNCESTGGSIVVPRDELDTTSLRQEGYQYRHDMRDLSAITLEDVMQQCGADHIDVLKLDCEGSEYSILGETPSMDRLGVVVGEYHNTPKWEKFRAEKLGGWSYVRTHDGGLHGGLFHLLRKQPIQAPSTSPSLLRIAVPAGIGDSIWTLLSVPDMLKQSGASQVCISLCGGPPHRAKEFMERFDFVRSAENSDWRCVESEYWTKEGVYNWAPSQPGWHDEFDWMLQANRHLESGKRLEDWMPQFETDWQIADRFHFTGAEVRLARSLRRELGPYCVFYLGPKAGNTTAGHNRGPLWHPHEWGELATLCREAGMAIVVTGAKYDRDYFEGEVAAHLGSCFDAVGKWRIGETFAVIHRSQFFVAYQSGLGVFSVYLDVPTAMFWRPHGDSVDPNAFVSFDEKMASAWSPPDALSSGRHLPLIYTKCSPETIVEHAHKYDWFARG